MLIPLCYLYISSHQTDFIMINLKPLNGMGKNMQAFAINLYILQFDTIIHHMTSFY